MHINRRVSFASRSIKLCKSFSDPSAYPDLCWPTVRATTTQLHLYRVNRLNNPFSTTPQDVAPSAAPLLPIFRSCQLHRTPNPLLNNNSCMLAFVQKEWTVSHCRICQVLIYAFGEMALGRWNIHNWGLSWKEAFGAQGAGYASTVL